MPNNSLVVFDTLISQDADGRFCLNDLHKAAVLSGANERTKEPAKFLASSQISDLIQELCDTQNLGITPVNVIKGNFSNGINQGTYVVKQLVYAYAMWISAKFHLHVINAYDALVTGQIPDYLKPITAPITLAEFERRTQSLQTAQNALKNAQIIMSGADIQKINHELSQNKAFDIVAGLMNTPVFKAKRWTDHDKTQLCQLYNKGYSHDRIAREMGRTNAGVEYAIAKYLTKKAGA